MNEQDPGAALWQRFWQLLLDAPLPPPQHVVSMPARLDDEFDFLGEVASAPPQPVAPQLTLDRERMAQFSQFSQQLQELADVLAQLRDALRDDARLDRVDAAGALWLCRVLLLAPPRSLGESGALVRLLQRAARSPEPELVLAAADAILHLDARAAQLDLVARLHADPHSLGHAGVDRVLAALKQIADGRCVREMEALLVARGDELSDVHAWQARHIVQVIRRSGRK